MFSSVYIFFINRNEKVSIIHYSMQMTFDSWQQTYFNNIVSKIEEITVLVIIYHISYGGFLRYFIMKEVL